MKDSCTLVADTLHQLEQLAPDTSTVCVAGTTVVSVADMPGENQPNGWWQLGASVIIPLIVVFITQAVSRFFEHKDEREARKRYRETVLDWIVKIMPIEEAFNQTVKLLSQSIETSDDMQPVPYAMPLALHDKMGNMTVGRMTDSFLRDFKKEKDERYTYMYNIISNFEFLSKITEGVKQSYDVYNKQMFGLCREWNSTYESFINKYNAYSQPNLYQTTVEAWQLDLIKHPGSPKTHMRFLDKLFIIADDTKDYAVQELVNRMRHIVLQSQATSKGFAVNFSSMSQNIELTLQSLMSSEQYFRGKKDL